ncbi:MAG TPA: NBR1-Ig-like domain-containing protein [Anaerolineales bacterium]|nr:NBR1-Ig-like domain-containing protein [Anaerolineales bacterium]
MKHFLRLLLFSILFILGAIACNLPGVDSTPDPLPTYAAQTVVARLTESAGDIQEPPPTIALTPSPATPTELSESPTNTNTPIPTTTAEVCDRAAFVADVTIPDGTVLARGETFTKTWRLRNTGTCTWSSSYALVFDSGDSLGGPASKQLVGTIAPNQTVDISVDLIAPTEVGTFRGNWRLRSDAGVHFGIGNFGDVAFYVEIETPDVGEMIAYDFVANYCSAEWRSDVGVLPCPGTTGDSEGFVISIAFPKLEDGTTENEPALETHPQWINDGVITGKFPAFDVQSGDQFRTIIGCLYDAALCNVQFQFNYRADGGSLQNLGSWVETSDGNIRLLEVDLSSLAGKSVEFVLGIHANGTYNQDWAFWLYPHIRR